MTKRRPLTPEETAESLRLKAIYEARKNDAKVAGQKLTQADVAEACGWSGQSAFSQFATGKIPMNIEALLALSKALSFEPEEVSPRLAEKIGRSSHSEVRAALSPHHQDLTPISAWDDNTPLDDDEVEVPFLKEVELSAGSGRTVIQESSRFKLRFGKYTLRRQNVQVEHAVCVPINGNSMEPVLRSGATVGVDRSKTQVIDGDLYALNHSGQLRVKQLYRLPGGGIRLRSFNRDEHPDEEYTLEQMQALDISLIGRVFWGAMFF